MNEVTAKTNLLGLTRTELEAFVYASGDKPRRKKREVQEGQPRGKQADGAAGDEATAGEAED